MKAPDALKRLVAPREMAELDRWRNCHLEYAAALRNCPGVGLVLRSLKASVEGLEVKPLSELRDYLNGADARGPS
jgi:hypothetical protein